MTGSGTQWSLTWRGCAVVSDDSWLNSVAALPDGGFLTTSMMPRTTDMEKITAALTLGEPTGSALEWTPASGWRVLDETHAPLPNGIEISPDGQTFFLNLTGANEVRRYDRETLKLEATASIPSPDNIRFSPGGQLLVASLLPGDSGDFDDCSNLEQGACPTAFQIVEIDPDSMTTEVLYRNQGPPMGAGTVGLWVGREILIGSFAGDRILRVQLD